MVAVLSYPQKTLPEAVVGGVELSFERSQCGSEG